MGTLEVVCSVISLWALERLELPIVLLINSKQYYRSGCQVPRRSSQKTSVPSGARLAELTNHAMCLQLK